MFTERDRKTTYDEENAVSIELNGDSAVCGSDSVQIAESTVSIVEEGTYILSGALDDGMLIVEADDTDKVQIVLNGAQITSSSSAAVYVLSADKVFITTVVGTENTLANSGEYVAIDDNNIDAAVFSKSDLTLNGEGSLCVSAAVGHGIVSKDDLVLTSGTYEITAASHGLSGKDSVRIAGGSYTIQSGKDGIHAENADDAKPWLCLYRGRHLRYHSGRGRHERCRISAGRWRRLYDNSRRRRGRADFGRRGCARKWQETCCRVA